MSKQGFLLGIALILAFSISGCSNNSDYTFSQIALQPGKQAPDFTLQTVDGQNISLSDFLGQPVLVNFCTATYVPCQREILLLQSTYEKYADRDLVIIAVIVRQSSSTVREMPTHQSIPFPVVLDVDGKTSDEYQIITIPTSFFIDSEGLLRDVNLGDTEDIAELELSLQKILPPVG